MMGMSDLGCGRGREQQNPFSCENSLSVTKVENDRYDEACIIAELLQCYPYLILSHFYICRQVFIWN